MKSERLVFTSSAFQPSPGEDAETNPGIFGRSLAEWLAQTLPAGGLPTGEVVPEDFGWLVPVLTSPHKTYVACASSEEPDSQWQIFVFAEGGLLARLLGKDSREGDVRRAFEQVQSSLRNHAAVHDIRVEP